MSGTRLKAGTSHKQLAPVIADEMKKYQPPSVRDKKQGKPIAPPKNYTYSPGNDYTDEINRKSPGSSSAVDKDENTSYSYKYSYNSETDAPPDWGVLRNLFEEYMDDKGGAERVYALATGMFTVFVLLFFMPTLIAFVRRSDIRWIVFVVNLLFGMTVIGWFAALVLAFNSKQNGKSGWSKAIEAARKSAAEQKTAAKASRPHDNRQYTGSPWSSKKDVKDPYSAPKKSEEYRMQQILEDSPTHFESIENDPVIEDNMRSREALAPSKLILMGDSGLAGQKGCPRCGEMVKASQKKCPLCNYRFDD